MSGVITILGRKVSWQAARQKNGDVYVVMTYAWQSIAKTVTRQVWDDAARMALRQIGRELVREMVTAYEKSLGEIR